MKTQEVAKIILMSPEGVILPYGPSQRLNLPGGGLDEGELPLEGLARELDEEIGLPLSELSPVWVGAQKFVTTSGSGEMQIRNWSIFAAATDFRPGDLFFGEEIEGVIALSPEQLYVSPKANKSAKVATALAHRATRLRLR